MKLARYLFKPDWQSKDAATRRAAIDSDRCEDAGLAAALPRLAREDDDAGVRLAALKRAADPAIAQTLARDDADASVRKLAHALWLDLLAGTHNAAPPLTERLRMLGAQDDARVLEHIARHGADVESRTAALARVERSTLIVERAIEDPDPQLRLDALERIDNEAQLERIAERMRKTDKRVSRRAKEKIDALRLGRNDNGTIVATATSLCERIEHLLRHGDDADAETAIEAQWAALGDQAPAALAMRFAAARQLLDARRDPEKIAFARARATTIEAIETELLALEHDLGQARVHQHDELSARFEILADRWVALADSSLTQRKANERRLRTITSRLADLAARKPAVRMPPTPEQIAEATRIAEEKVASEARRAHELAVRAAFDSALAAFEQALDSGSSAAAHAAHEAMTEARKQCSGAWDPPIRKRLERAHQRYQEIAGWQRWSVTKRRRELCAEIEGLASAGLHPDAVATRVREAQTEWSRLDAADKSGSTDASASAPASADHLARHFRKVCRLAIEPVRPYFEKRDELRQSQRSAIDDLLRRASAEPAEPPALRDLVALRRDCAAALRVLDGVDPRERKALAEQLKSALGALDTRIAEIEGFVETAKTALIGEAELLSRQADAKVVASGSRDLQRRWQATGQGRRKRDDAQWKLFRGALDAGFANVDAVRAQGAADAQRKLDDAMALCAELERLAGSDEAPERGAVTHIDDAWRALAVADESLRRRYRDAQFALRDAAEQRARRKHRARHDHWLAHYRLCRALERGELAGDAAREQRAGLPPIDFAKDALLARFEQALCETTNDANSRAEDHAAARDCLIELEQLAGIESPPDDRQRRLDLQVARLSDKLRGKHNSTPEQTFENLLARWVDIGVSNDLNAFDARFEHAYRAIVESL